MPYVMLYRLSFRPRVTHAYAEVFVGKVTLQIIFTKMQDSKFVETFTLKHRIIIEMQPCSLTAL